MATPFGPIGFPPIGSPGGGTGGEPPPSGGVVYIQTFTLTVKQPPVISSPNNATFTVGAVGTFNVSTTGYPAPTITVGGALPSGVTFSGGVLSGTPAAGSGGIYALTFTATNNSGSVSQSFTLTVRQAPAITSAASATFTAGAAGVFSVTTSGFPAPSIARGGSLPAGMSFVDNGNGTGSLFGTPTSNTGGTYTLTFQATNVAGTSVVQTFTLTVRQLPAFTSPNAATFMAGVAGSFSVITTGFPTPTLLRTGTLPTGVTFTDNGNGTGTLAGTPGTGTAGTYPLTLTASNTAGSTPQSFSLVVAAPNIPQFTSAASTTFKVGTAGTFNVTTNPPAATISSSGGAGNGGGDDPGVSISTALLPAEYQTTWKPGVRGIPVRNTIFATIDPATYSNGAVDASAGIQAVINACPAGQVVQLMAGTFLVNDFLLINKGITLRGAGMGPNGTTLLRTETNQEQIIIVGPSRFPRIDEATATLLASDAVKGAMSVTLTSATGFAAGQFVKLDEDDYTTATFVSMPPQMNGAPLASLQSDRLSWPLHQPALAGDLPIPGGLTFHSRSGRPLCETKEIASVSGNVVTFTTPIHIGYTTAKAAQLTRYTGAANVFTTGAGVENLTTDGGRDGNISFLCAAKSWVRNCEVKNYGNPGVDIKHGYRIEVRDSYIHDTAAPHPGGGGYAFSIQQGASEVLLENNIIINANKVMVARSCGAGSVVGYNYTDDGWIDYDPGWQEVGLNGSHMIGSHHILFEGNRSYNSDSDDTWGSAIYMTTFRNHLTGKRRSFTDVTNVRCVGLMFGSWNHAIIGNVLGESGQMGGWVLEDPGDGTYGTTTSRWGTTTKAVYRLGYAPGRWGQAPDTRARTTAIKDGNYDYVSNSALWDRTPQSLPDSLYLSAKPSFFSPSQTWPWVDALGATKVYELPAYQRYQAILAGSDLNTGSLPAGLTFVDNGNGTATIAGTPAPGTAGTYNLLLTAASPGGTTTQAFTLTVQQTPAFTSGSSTSMTETVAGTFTVTTTGNPTTTITKSGALPTGVTFTDNGNGTATIAGTPGGGTAGTYPLTLTATNAAGATNQSFTLTVAAAAPGAPSITSGDSTTFTTGTPGTFTVTTSPVASTITVAGTLPSGVSFVQNGDGTATLGGTPAAGVGGTYSLVITATNVSGSDVQNFTLTVRQAPTVTSPSSVTFTVGAAGSFTVTTTGFPVPSLSRGGDALPTGVTFTDNGNGTGTLAGTPGTGTGGSYSLTFTATNAAGSSPAQAFALTVTTPPDPPPVFTSPSTTTFQVGVAGTFTITTSPAASTITRSGTLPSGVTFTDNGGGTATLAGTPAAGVGGTYNFTVTATNSGGSVSQAFILTVRQLPAITSAASVIFTEDSLGTFTVTSTGFPAATIVRGGAALPNGLTFVSNGNGTGTLSGVATDSGNFALTFTATNAAGSSAPQSFNLKVRNRPHIISADTTTFDAGSAGTFTVQAEGFEVPTLTIGGTPPSGVTFADNGDGTGTLAGTPAAGTGGTYSLFFTATNPAGTDQQDFVLHVQEDVPPVDPPVFTSAPATSFLAGEAGTFTITTAPAATTLTRSGPFPAGVTLVDHGDGTATLSGLPVAGTGGVYAFNIVATNAGGVKVQDFTLTVYEAPIITSAISVTFTVGDSESFTVTATGYPDPDLALTSGELPDGLSFSSGTGAVSGIPLVVGEFTVGFTATNTAGSDEQGLVVTVEPVDDTGGGEIEEPPVTTPPIAGEGGPATLHPDVAEYADFVSPVPDTALRQLQKDQQGE